MQLTVPDPLHTSHAAQRSQGHLETSRIGEIEQNLKTSDVLRITGRHRCTLYRWMEQRPFPKKRPFKGHPVGWARSDVESWMGKLKLQRTAK